MPPRLPPSVERALALPFLSLPSPVLRRIVGPPKTSPDGLVLDLQVQGLLWLMATMRIPELAVGDVASARLATEKSAPTLDVAPFRGVSVYERAMPGGNGPVMARVYKARDGRLGGGLSPGLVYFHGGGWVLGSLDTHDRVCRALARDAGVTVISVAYRLAPEHPLPASAEDAVAASRWVLANAESLGVDRRRVAVGGDSAGGNLAAVATQALRGENLRPAFQLLIYPGTDLTRSQPSHRLFSEGYFLTKSGIDWYLERFAPDPATRADPRGSPLLASDLSGLPPAFVVTAGFDPLRDEGRTYAERMRAAGGKVDHACVEGAVHGVLLMAGGLRVGAHMLSMAAESLKSGLGLPPS